MLINFRGSFDPQNFFNSWRLHNGRAPGAFLVFSLIPGIGRVGIAGCNAVAVRSSCRSDIYLGRCGRACTLIRWSLLHKCLLNFRGWSQPRNCFNSEIFPIYGTCNIDAWTLNMSMHHVWTLLKWCDKWKSYDELIMDSHNLLISSMAQHFEPGNATRNVQPGTMLNFYPDCHVHVWS